MKGFVASGVLLFVLLAFLICMAFAEINITSNESINVTESTVNATAPQNITESQNATTCRNVTICQNETSCKNVTICDNTTTPQNETLLQNEDNPFKRTRGTPKPPQRP